MALFEKKRSVSSMGCIIDFVLLAPLLGVYIYYLIGLFRFAFGHQHDSHIISPHFRFIFISFLFLLTFQVTFLIFGAAIPNFLFPKRERVGSGERAVRLLPVIIAIPGSIVLNFLALQGLEKTFTEGSLDIIFYVLIGGQIMCALALISWVFGGGEEKTISFACPYRLRD